MFDLPILKKNFNLHKFKCEFKLNLLVYKYKYSKLYCASKFKKKSYAPTSNLNFHYFDFHIQLEYVWLEFWNQIHFINLYLVFQPNKTPQTTFSLVQIENISVRLISANLRR